MVIMDEYGNKFVDDRVDKRVINETTHNFSLEFVDNGAILTYEDGMRCVVQGKDEDVFAFIGEDLKGATLNAKLASYLDYDFEIKIKAKE